MNAKQYKVYPKYKVSGIEWLHQIPEQWEVKKAKYSTKILNGATPSSNEDKYWNEGDIKWATPKDLSSNKNMYLHDTDRHITKEGFAACGVNMVNAGAIILSTRAPIGLLSIAKDKMCFNQGCKGMESKQIANNVYLYYFLYISNAILNSLGKGTTFIELSNDSLSSFVTSIPSLLEQEKIAEFLDAKVGHIDRLVSKLEEQLKLIDEQRNSLITETVCKGLNPKAPMKDSGIQWLGKIPTHWKAKKLKYLARIFNGATPSSGEEMYWKDGDIKWATPSDLSSNNSMYLYDTIRNITQEGYNSCGVCMVRKGSVILSTRAPIGLLSIAENEMCFNQGCRGIEVKEFINNIYLYYFLYISNSILNSLGKGTTFIELSTDSLATLQLPLPPLSEQQEIIAYLDEKLSKIDALKSKTIKQIELLKEYKTSLITNVVTGKIDVRNEVI